ncbi:MAG: zinc metalloprotease HtpX [Thiotrichales bacterium]
MNAKEIARHKRLNTIQTVLMLAGVLGVLALVGWSFGGAPMMVGLLLAGGLLAVIAPRISPTLVLRMYRAVALDRYTAPGMVRTVAELARRAGLPVAPGLYYIPSQTMNAFAVGDREQASIAITDGLLRRLDDREITAVLAHEMSHIRNNDMRVMGLADTLSRLTHSMSLVGLLMLLLNLPLVIVGGQTVSWLGALLLLLAPQLTALLQLGLSRSREYDADLGAVELTGDPNALASALRKLEYYGNGVFEQILLPGRRSPDPSLLRTHPRIEDRIARLRDLAPARWASVGIRADHGGTPALDALLDLIGRRISAPRSRFSGLWY